MLTPVSRYRYNDLYLYGSAAFVAGFAGILVLLINFAPVRVANVSLSNASYTHPANKDITATAPQPQQTTADTDTAPTSNQSYSPDTTTVDSTPDTSTDTSTQPAATADPVTSATPVDTTQPTTGTDTPVTTDPAEPIDTTVPPATDPSAQLLAVPLVQNATDLTIDVNL